LIAVVCLTNRDQKPENTILPIESPLSTSELARFRLAALTYATATLSGLAISHENSVRSRMRKHCRITRVDNLFDGTFIAY